MIFKYQKYIADAQATLPVVSAVALAVWVLLPVKECPMSFSGVEYGLWDCVPRFLKEGYWAKGLGIGCVALAVYLMAELNNANVLLRVNSRMLSSMLVLLTLFVCPCLDFQPGSVVLVLALLSCFPLMASYQHPAPIYAFETFLLISLASLVFPKVLWLTPLYWFLQGYLRAFSIRCFAASVLALLLPYWIYAGVAFVQDWWPGFMTHVWAIVDVKWDAFAFLDVQSIWVFGFVFLLFVTGAIDFFVNRLKDKTRTRILYNSLIIHGIYILFLILLFPHLFWTFFLLLLIDTAIVFGHYFTLTHTKFSHIFCLLLLMMALALAAYRYAPDFFHEFNLKDLIQWIL